MVTCIGGAVGGTPGLEPQKVAKVEPVRLGGRLEGWRGPTLSVQLVSWIPSVQTSAKHTGSADGAMAATAIGPAARGLA